MSEQPQEWTPEFVAKILEQTGDPYENPPEKQIADVHNAELAAERSLRETAQSNADLWHEEMMKSDERLAAEREKSSMVRFAPMALDEVEELRQQLAAEREKVKSAAAIIHKFHQADCICEWCELAKVKESK
jgi:hypothetical protein